MHLRRVLTPALLSLCFTAAAHAQTATVTSANQSGPGQPIDVIIRTTGEVELLELQFKDGDGNNLAPHNLTDENGDGPELNGNPSYYTTTVTNPPAGAAKIRVKFSDGTSATWTLITVPPV